MNRFQRAALGRILPLLLAGPASCGNDFDPVSKVDSVRILASRADKPYARPGDSVQLEVLAVDGRRDRPEPMAVHWLPSPCIDPEGDAYESCFPAFEGAFARGVDLAPQLAPGPTLSLSIPADVLSRGASPRGGAPFASVYAFTMACAGHVEYVGRRGPSRQSPPFACFDAAGRELGAGDFVFAYARVFVFEGLGNANPVIDAVTVDGRTIDPAAGLVVDRCATPSGNGEDPTCATYALDVVVPPSSHELDPSNVDPKGNVLREELWVDYYVSGGKIKNDVRVLYDPSAGKLSSADDLEAPSAAGEAMLWAVVHDNRGGVSWAQVPLHTR